MQWKPIPTRETLYEIFGDDGFCTTLFVWLLINASDTEKMWTDKETGKSIMLQRGQVVFGRNKYASIMGLERTQSKKVERALEKLEKIAKQIAKQPNRNFTLVSIINYDQLCPRSQANSQAVAKQQPSSSQAVATSIHNTINNNNTTNVVDIPEEVVEKEFGNPEINRMINRLREFIGITDFIESKKIQRIWGNNLVRLRDKIGQEEFNYRITELHDNPYKKMMMNSLQKIFDQVKGFIPRDPSLKS